MFIRIESQDYYAYQKMYKICEELTCRASGSINRLQQYYNID